MANWFARQRARLYLWLWGEPPKNDLPNDISVISRKIMQEAANLDALVSAMKRRINQ